MTLPAKRPARVPENVWQGIQELREEDRKYGEDPLIKSTDGFLQDLISHPESAVVFEGLRTASSRQVMGALALGCGARWSFMIGKRTRTVLEQRAFLGKIADKARELAELVANQGYEVLGSSPPQHDLFLRWKEGGGRIEDFPDEAIDAYRWEVLLRALAAQADERRRKAREGPLRGNNATRVTALDDARLISLILPSVGVKNAHAVAAALVNIALALHAPDALTRDTVRKASVQLNKRGK